ncbi:hypothetical protein D3C81_1279520 [compost metagenome]
MAAGDVGRAAEHAAVRAHEILHSRAFLQELGVRDHRVLQVFQPARGQFLTDGGGHAVAGAHWHGGLVHHHLEAGHVAADVARGGQHVLQVGRAVFVRGRAHGNELHVGVLHAGRHVGRKRQAAGSAITLDQLLEARLIDRHAASIEHGDLAFVHIETEHRIAEFRQAGAGDQADIAATDNCDFHSRSSRTGRGSTRDSDQPSASERRGA